MQIAKKSEMERSIRCAGEACKTLQAGKQELSDQLRSLAETAKGNGWHILYRQFLMTILLFALMSAGCETVTNYDADPDMIRLNVYSDPAGAEIYVGGKSYGKAPCPVYYRIPQKQRSTGKIVTEPIEARWANSASRKNQLTLYLSKGLRQQYTFKSEDVKQYVGLTPQEKEMYRKELDQFFQDIDKMSPGWKNRERRHDAGGERKTGTQNIESTKDITVQLPVKEAKSYNSEVKDNNKSPDSHPLQTGSTPAEKILRAIYRGNVNAEANGNYTVTEKNPDATVEDSNHIETIYQGKINADANGNYIITEKKTVIDNSWTKNEKWGNGGNNTGNSQTKKLDAPTPVKDPNYIETIYRGKYNVDANGNYTITEKKTEIDNSWAKNKNWGNYGGNTDNSQTKKSDVPVKDSNHTETIYQGKINADANGNYTITEKKTEIDNSWAKNKNWGNYGKPAYDPYNDSNKEQKDAEQTGQPGLVATIVIGILKCLMR